MRKHVSICIIALKYFSHNLIYYGIFCVKLRLDCMCTGTGLQVVCVWVFHNYYLCLTEIKCLEDYRRLGLVLSSPGMTHMAYRYTPQLDNLLRYTGNFLSVGITCYGCFFGRFNSSIPKKTTYVDILIG